MHPAKLFSTATVLLSLVCSGGSAEPSNKTAWTIPFTDEGVCIRIPVNCFGQTLYFIVDTGTTVPIFDTRFAQYLGEPIEEGRVNTTGVDLTGAKIYSCPDLSFNGLPLRADKALCQSLRTVWAVTGEHCDGILGILSLKQYAVTLDFDTRRLLIARALPEEAKQHAIALPLVSVERAYPAVDVLLNNRHSATLMIDSSDSCSISLNPADWNATFVGTDKSRFHPTSAAALESIPGGAMLTKLASLKLGTIEQTNLICTLIPNPQTPSTLGIGFLRRYKAVFDFPGQMLYLSPSKYSNEPDIADMSGLHLIRTEEGTVVYAVDEGSAAASADIRSGDKLLAIDGQKTNSMPLAAIRQHLKSGDGIEVHLELQRQSAHRDTVLRLRSSL